MADNSGWESIASSAVTTMGNAAVAAASNRRQYKNQVKAMAEQAKYNKELWDYQNAYNTPQQQMARLQAAGLNPHLIYGAGSAGAGNAGSIAPAEVPTQQATRAEFSDPMSNYLQRRQMDAQYAATTQNIEIAKQRSALMDIQTGMNTLKLFEEQSKSKNYKLLAQAQLDLSQFTALRAGELFANEKTKGNLMDQLGDLRSEQLVGTKLDNTFKTYRNDLAKMGIYSSDSPGWRILIRASKRLGIDLDEIIKGGLDKFSYLLK